VIDYNSDYANLFGKHQLIYGIIPMDKWIIENQVTITLAISAAAALATIIYSVFTFILVNETIKLRKIETDPDIIIYLEPFQANFVNMIIKNIGRGAATNITFAFDHDHPLANLSSPQGTPLNGINLFNGLPYLAPRHEIKFFFLSVKEFPDPNAIQSINISMNFHNNKGEQLTSTYTLSISDFIGLRWLGSNPLEDTSKALRDIRTDLHAVMMGSRINVNNFPQAPETNNEGDSLIEIDDREVEGDALS
jgi:hypothetical protein